MGLRGLTARPVGFRQRPTHSPLATLLPRAAGLCPPCSPRSSLPILVGTRDEMQLPDIGAAPREQLLCAHHAFQQVITCPRGPFGRDDLVDGTAGAGESRHVPMLR